MESANRKTVLFLASAVFFVFLINFFFGSYAAKSTSAASIYPLTGYAWSDTIGWIQTDPVFGGVYIDLTTGSSNYGNLHGYAWADSIGWVSFDAADGTHPSAKLNGTTKKINGWIQAVSGNVGSGGWDGWSKMTGVGSGYVCSLSGEIYLTQAECTGVCQQSATCNLNNVTTSGTTGDKNSLVKAEPASGGTQLKFTDNTGSVGFVDLSGATVSNIVGNGTIFRRVISSGSQMTFYSSAGPISSITLIGANASSDDVGRGTPFTKVIGNGNKIDFYDSAGLIGSITLSGNIYSCPLGSYACSGSPSTCTQTGSCNISNPIYEVKVNADDTLSGYAWGSDVVGWISFKGMASDGSPYVVKINRGLNVTLTANPLLGAAPLTSTLTATVFGDISGLLTYQFDCGNGQTQEYANVSGSSKTHSCVYNAQGDYLAKIHIINGVNTADDDVNITAQTNTNILAVNFSQDSYSGNTGSPISLTMQVTGSATGDITYKLYCDIGNSTPDYNFSSSNITETRSCIYSSAGTHTPKVHVDRDGQSAEATVDVVVSPATPYFSINSQNINISKFPDIGATSNPVTVSVAPSNGFNSDITLSADLSSVPGATYDFSKDVLTSADYSTGSQFIVTIPADTSSGTYNLELKGVGGGQISTKIIQLKVNVSSPGWEPD